MTLEAELKGLYQRKAMAEKLPPAAKQRYAPQYEALLERIKELESVTDTMEPEDRGDPYLEAIFRAAHQIGAMVWPDGGLDLDCTKLSGFVQTMEAAEREVDRAYQDRDMERFRAAVTAWLAAWQEINTRWNHSAQIGMVEVDERYAESPW